MKSYSPPSPSTETVEDGVVSYAPLVAMGLLVILAGVYWGLPLVLMIFGVIAMITIHELGHFLTAKWAGMKVTEFFIGFGPRLWSFSRGETEYGIKAIPAGAYVRIIGMNNLDEVPPEDEARSYRQQSFPKRVIVVLAGPATHLIQAFVILMIMFAIVGVPDGEPLGADPEKANTWVVDTITKGSAAEAAGLRSGDRIVEFDGHEVSTWGDVSDLIGAHEIGDTVTVKYQRDAQDDGPIVEKSITLKRRPADIPGNHDNAFLGVGAGVPSETFGVLDSVGRSITGTGEVTWQSLVAMGRFFSPTGISDYADTVGNGAETPTQTTGSSHATSSDDEGTGSNRMLSILGVLQLGSDAGEQGLVNLLPIFLMINVFVGMINLVPLLPFDGGHAAVAVYERIRSRDGRRYHADVSKLLPVAYAVVMGLVILGVTSLYLDIVNPI